MVGQIDKSLFLRYVFGAMGECLIENQNKIGLFLEGMVLDMLDFAFPRTCVVCGDLLIQQERDLCFSCYASLPYSVYGLSKSNPICRGLAGRIPLNLGYFLLDYRRNSGVSKIMKAIKYEGAESLAVKLGKEMGERIFRDYGDPDFTHFAVIPMHSSKLRKRGYNQAICLAEGITEVLSGELIVDLFLQPKRSISQTKKNRAERLTSSESKYLFNPKYKGLTLGHLCLVDDVMTTGSTIESCLKSCLHFGDIGVQKISVMTAACVL
jgi:predicted amidophosphoribosyltransferase